MVALARKSHGPQRHQIMTVLGIWPLTAAKSPALTKSGPCRGRLPSQGSPWWTARDSTWLSCVIPGGYPRNNTHRGRAAGTVAVSAHRPHPAGYPSVCALITARSGGAAKVATGPFGIKLLTLSGGDRQLRAVVGGAAGQVGAVPVADLPDAAGGRGARPGRRQQLVGQVRVHGGERAPLIHHPGAGDQGVHRGDLAGLGLVPQQAGERDELLVPLAQPGQVPGAGEDLRRLTAGGHRGGTEGGRGADPQLLQPRHHVAGVVPRRDPHAVVQRREAEPPQRLAQLVTDRPVVLGDGERDKRPLPVPRRGAPPEGEDAPRAVVEHVGGA